MKQSSTLFGVEVVSSYRELVDHDIAESHQVIEALL